MSLHTPVSKAVRWALLGAVAATVAAPQAFAADEPKGEVERIEVTGSRIKRTDVESAAPVMVLDRQAIEKSGVTTAGELLQRAPAIAGAATNPQVNNGGGDGASTISLRGLGDQRTLVLLNGRRFITNDVNSVPMNIIERVEILKDGASAIYGSDAIAGVVNFITRRDFEGVAANVYHGETSEGDGKEDQLDVTAGTSSEKGNFVVGMNYVRQTAIGAGDRQYSNKDRSSFDGEIIEGGSPTPPGGRVAVPIAAAQAAGARVDLNSQVCQDGMLDLDSDGANDHVYLFRDQGDGTKGSDFRCMQFDGPGNDQYNFQPENLVKTPQERKSFFFQGSYSLTDDVEYFNYSSYSNVQSNSRIAPLPQGGLGIAADNPYNPFGVDINMQGEGDAGIRALGFGPRQPNIDTTDIELINGLRGSFGDSWSWDVSYDWGESKQLVEQHGYIYKPALDLAFGSLTDCEETPGCTPANFWWLGDPTVDNQAVRDLKDAAAPVLRANDVFRQQLIEANLTGDLFDLPAGPLGFATGVQHRWVELEHNPDYLAITGKVSDEAGDTALRGEYDVNELYAEFNIPLLVDAPLAKSLEVSIGSRYADYSTFGETTNSKIGFLYQPVDDLKLRGTWAQVFRAPTISNLFSGQTPAADTFKDPCNGIATPGNPACVGVPTSGTFNNPFRQVNSTKGGNQLLQPETGNSLTAGLVFAPNWLPEFSTTIDFYRIEVEDTIGSVGTQRILDTCFTTGVFCDRIQRTASGLLGPEGTSGIIDTTSNLGKLEAEGIDWNVRYTLPETSFGVFGFNFESTYIIKHDNTALANAPQDVVHNAGRFLESNSGGDGNYGRWRALTNFSWSYGDWDANYALRYFHHAEEPWNKADACLAAATPANVGTKCPNMAEKFGSYRDIPSFTYHDVQMSYNVSSLKTKLTLGVENLMDKQPPTIFTGFSADTDVRTYDTSGRFMYVKASTSF